VTDAEHVFTSPYGRLHVRPGGVSSETLKTKLGDMSDDELLALVRDDTLEVEKKPLPEQTETEKRLQCVWNYSYLTLMRRFLDLAARHRWSCPNETLCRRAIRV
jgi:hypothetical protein